MKSTLADVVTPRPDGNPTSLDLPNLVSELVRIAWEIRHEG